MEIEPPQLAHYINAANHPPANFITPGPIQPRVSAPKPPTQLLTASMIHSMQINISRDPFEWAGHGGNIVEWQVPSMGQTWRPFTALNYRQFVAAPNGGYGYNGEMVHVR